MISKLRLLVCLGLLAFGPPAFAGFLEDSNSLSGAPTVDDSTITSTSASAYSWKALPNCTDTTGNHLNYQTGGSFTCGSSQQSKGSILQFGLSGSVSTSTTNYWGDFATVGTGTAPSTCLTTHAGMHTFPKNGALKNLYCRTIAGTTPGAGKQYAITLYGITEGVLTLTCTISGTGTTCNDTGHADSVVAGQCYVFKTVPSGTPTAAGVHCALEYDM